jgi:hypothetical protein
MVCQHEYGVRHHKPCCNQTNQSSPRRGHPKHPLGKPARRSNVKLELAESRSGTGDRPVPQAAIKQCEWVCTGFSERNRGAEGGLSERVGRQLTWLRLSSAALRSSGTWLSAARSTTARLGRSMSTGDGWPAEAEDRALRRPRESTGGGESREWGRPGVGVARSRWSSVREGGGRVRAGERDDATKRWCGI